MQPGDTWSTIAQAVYGNTAVATQLATALGNPTLSVGLDLVGLPASLSTGSGGTVTVPAYYVVPSGATWASITQAVYGTSDSAAVAALQAATGNPTLTTGLHLTVPLTLTYGGSGGSGTPGISTEISISNALGLVTTFTNDGGGHLVGIKQPSVASAARVETRFVYDAAGNVTSITEDWNGPESRHGVRVRRERQRYAEPRRCRHYRQTHLQRHQPAPHRDAVHDAGSGWRWQRTGERGIDDPLRV